MSRIYGVRFDEGMRVAETGENEETVNGRYAALELNTTGKRRMGETGVNKTK